MRGGVTKLEWAGDVDCLGRATVNLNGGNPADLVVRNVDPDNTCAVRRGKANGRGTGPIPLLSVRRGDTTTLAHPRSPPLPPTANRHRPTPGGHGRPLAPLVLDNSFATA